jgi:serine/threonine protein phosphatase PrpC
VNKVEFCSKKSCAKTINQDNIFIINNKDTKYLGIFDGHGPYGDDVSTFCMFRMIQLINENEYLTNAFLTMIQENDFKIIY